MILCGCNHDIDFVHLGWRVQGPTLEDGHWLENHHCVQQSSANYVRGYARWRRHHRSFKQRTGGGARGPGRVMIMLIPSTHKPTRAVTCLAPPSAMQGRLLLIGTHSMCSAGVDDPPRKPLSVAAKGKQTETEPMVCSGAPHTAGRSPRG